MVEITKDDFEDYERVRKGGLTNMFAVATVCDLSDNLDKEKVFEIMENYEELMKKFPEVRGQNY